MADERPRRKRAEGLEGDAARHLPFDALERGLAALSCPPTGGRLEMIVVRGEDHARSTPASIRLSVELGVCGDAWEREWADEPDAQITLMRSDVGRLVGNGQPLWLFGDNLLVELDLSRGNLPAGTRLRMGGATLEITPKPHRGCKKYAKRFGADALRLTAHERYADLRLRGVYARAVVDGEVAVGDRIEVLRG